jgi:hypothetical protein
MRGKHWGAKAKLVRKARVATSYALVQPAELRHAVRRWGNAYALDVDAPQLVVTITRVAPRMLDPGDNIATACKPVRDQIAEALGVDDRDSRITWRVGQRRGKPKEYACEVEIVELAQAVRDLEWHLAPDEVEP